MPPYSDEADPLSEVCTPTVISVGVTPGALDLFPAAPVAPVAPVAGAADPDEVVELADPVGPFELLLEELQPAASRANSANSAALPRTARRVRTDTVPSPSIVSLGVIISTAMLRVKLAASGKTPTSRNAVSEDGSIRSFPRRAAAKADTHRRIVRSALALFQRHGYEETRVEDIAALAGVTKRTVFLHFPTKADLLFDVAAEELHRLDTLILAQPLHDNDVQTLEHALLELCRGMDRKVRHKQLKLLLRAAATSAELRGRQLDYNQMMVDSAAAALARRHGAQTASLSSLTASRAVFRIFHALLIDWASERPEDLEEVARRHFAALNSVLTQSKRKGR